MRFPMVGNSCLRIGPDISGDSHGRSTYCTLMRQVILLDNRRWCHWWLVMYNAQTMVCAQILMYISRPKYMRQSPDCPLVIFSFTALHSCFITLHCTALPLPSIALSLLLILLLTAHTCTLIASILQEYCLQTPCPCYKCDRCLQ